MEKRRQDDDPWSLSAAWKRRRDEERLRAHLDLPPVDRLRRALALLKRAEGEDAGAC